MEPELVAVLLELVAELLEIILVEGVVYYYDFGFLRVARCRFWGFLGTLVEARCSTTGPEFSLRLKRLKVRLGVALRKVRCEVRCKFRK